MARKTLLTLSVSVTITTISMVPTAAFAQFSPDPPPMGPGVLPPVGAGDRGYSSDSDCYYLYRQQRRILVCD